MECGIDIPLWYHPKFLSSLRSRPNQRSILIEASPHEKRYVDTALQRSVALAELASGKRPGSAIQQLPRHRNLSISLS